MSDKVFAYFILGHVSEKAAIDEVKNCLESYLSQFVKKYSTSIDQLQSKLLDSFAKLDSSRSSELQKVALNELTVCLQCHPTVENLKTGLYEILQAADGSNLHLNVFYLGQIVEPSGEWLLADSSLHGYTISSWLDSKHNLIYRGILDHMASIHEDNPIQLHFFTPVGGEGTEWNFSKSKTGPSHGLSGQFYTVIQRFKARLNFITHAGLKAHNKAVERDNCASMVEPFMEKLFKPFTENLQGKIRSKWSEGMALQNQNRTKLFVRNAQPELYIFPVGDCANHSCPVLFNLDGFNILLGASYNLECSDPVFWPLFSTFDKIDAVFLPDWSAKSLFFQRFYSRVQGKDDDLRFGPLVVTQDEFKGSSPIALEKLKNDTMIHWPLGLNVEVTPGKFPLYHKVGHGDLSLQPLAHKTGSVLIWRTKKLCVRLFVPTEQITPPGGSCQAALVRLFKALQDSAHLCHAAAANPFATVEHPIKIVPAKRASTTTGPKKIDSTDGKAKPATARPTTAMSRTAMPDIATARPKTATAKSSLSAKPAEPRKASIPAQSATTATTAKPKTAPVAAKQAPLAAKQTPVAAKLAPVAATAKAPAKKQPSVANGTTAKGPTATTTNGTTTKKSAPTAISTSKSKPPEKPSAPVVIAKEKLNASPEDPSSSTVPALVDQSQITSDLIPDKVCQPDKTQEVISVTGLSFDLIPDSIKIADGSAVVNKLAELQIDENKQPEVFSEAAVPSPVPSVDSLNSEASINSVVAQKEIVLKPAAGSLCETPRAGPFVQQAQSVVQKSEPDPVEFDVDPVPVAPAQETGPIVHMPDSDLIEAKVEPSPFVFVPQNDAIVAKLEPGPIMEKAEMSEFSPIVEKPEADSLLEVISPAPSCKLNQTTNPFEGESLLDLSSEDCNEKSFNLSPNNPFKEYEHNGNGITMMTMGDNHGQKEPNGMDDFDPISKWGHPQNLPPTSNETATPVQAKKLSQAPVATHSEPVLTLPGSAGNVYLDVMLVPGYIVRVPFSLMVEFFTRVRARLYILSGEALNPNCGEALLQAQKHWNTQDTQTLQSLGGSFSAPQILATDEPNDWVRWLRSAAPTLKNDTPEDLSLLTGESRLQAAGFVIAPPANLQDIELTASNGMQHQQPVTCLGTKIIF